MLRDVLTNKWVLGGVGFLILLSVACVLWYQHDIAPEHHTEKQQPMQKNCYANRK